MIYLVITEKLTSEGRKDFKKVLEWQKKLDEWLMSHGAAWKSVKHFLTLIGEPVYQNWLEYPNFSALDKDTEKARVRPKPRMARADLSNEQVLPTDKQQAPERNVAS